MKRPFLSAGRLAIHAIALIAFTATTLSGQTLTEAQKIAQARATVAAVSGLTPAGAATQAQLLAQLDLLALQVAADQPQYATKAEVDALNAKILDILARLVKLEPVPSQAPVNALLSEWSAWTPTSEWSTCVNGTQSRTEERTRTVVTPASNGGTTGPLIDGPRTVTQACTVSTPPPPPDTSSTFAYFDQQKARPETILAVSFRDPAEVTKYKFGRYEVPVKSDPVMGAFHQWNTNDLNAEQIRLPFPLESAAAGAPGKCDRPLIGSVKCLLIADYYWDRGWLSEFNYYQNGALLPLDGWKQAQVTDNFVAPSTAAPPTTQRIWFEPQMRWIGQAGNAILAWFGNRAYSPPRAPTTVGGAGAVACGRNFLSDEVGPRTNCPAAKPNVWTRRYLQIVQTAGDAYAKVSMWYADEQTDATPMLVDAELFSGGANREWWPTEYNSSRPWRNGGPMFAAMRHALILKNVDVATTFARPVAGGTPPPAPPQWFSKFLLGIGDSYMAGANLGAPDTENFLYLLGQKLKAAGRTNQIINKGQRGWTVGEAVLPLADGTTQIDRAIAGLSDGSALLCLGGGDGQQKRDVNLIKADLATIITKLRAKGIRPLLCQLAANPADPTYAAAFGAIFPALSAQFQIPLMDRSYLYGFVATDMDTTLHPTAAGQVKIAENAWPMIDRYVK